MAKAEGLQYIWNGQHTCVWGQTPEKALKSAANVVKQVFKKYEITPADVVYKHEFNDMCEDDGVFITIYWTDLESVDGEEGLSVSRKWSLK